MICKARTQKQACNWLVNEFREGSLKASWIGEGGGPASWEENQQVGIFALPLGGRDGKGAWVPHLLNFFSPWCFLNRILFCNPFDTY